MTAAADFAEIRRTFAASMDAARACLIDPAEARAAASERVTAMPVEDDRTEGRAS